MGLDCREILDVKEYEFLLNWFIRMQQQHGLATLQEPFSYDGYSSYDQICNQLLEQARIAFIEQFGYPAPPLVFTNLFHLAELELAGKRNARGIKTPPQLM
ncbi:MAG: hypothetical protein U5L02_01665 [Rheinheimera sp.]|nr:hypothetical protein [Rheinheimera sp.]